MDPDALFSARDQLWFYLAAPVLALAALVLTVRLRAPQWRLLGKAFRGLRLRGGKDEAHPVAPGLATALASVGAFGAAAAVGSATAVSLGGAGVLPWLWLFGILLAPIRYGETLLAGTDAPGRGEKAASGSLPRRLLRMGDRWRVPRWLFLALTLFAGFTWAGGVQGLALRDAAAEILPGSTLPLAAGVAGVGALLVLGGARFHAVAGWIGAAGLLALTVAALWGFAADPGAAFGTLGRAFGDAFEGAPQLEDFTGAFAGEIAFAAVLHVLAPMGATAGVAGAINGLSTGKTRPQAAVSVLGPLFHAAVATLLVMAFVGTGAFGTRVASERGLDGVRVYRIAAETASQRAEGDRLYSGQMRIMEGQARNPTLSLGTDRGMVREPRFERRGEPADVALVVEDGRAIRIMAPGRFGALAEIDRSALDEITVQGEMLPTGAGLLVGSLEQGGGDLAGRFALAAILALAAVALAAWGFALGRSLPASAPLPAQIGAGLLPAAGALLAATGAAPWLTPLGGIAAALLATATGLLLLARTRELHELGK